MKSIKYLLISLAIICCVELSFACYGPWYTPKGYYMYRVYAEEPVSNVHEVSESEENCREWQEMTSQSIPIEDIDSVVYKMPLEVYEEICKSRKTNGDNKFLKWIVEKDTAILDFLLLAKTTEYVRNQRNSRWYYPSMQQGVRMTLEEIADKALSNKDKRLHQRYLLQGIRALFSLSRYEKCIEIWDKEVVRLPENNLMRRMIKPYIEGAKFHKKRSEKAVEFFAESGDVESMLYCLNRMGEKLSAEDALSLVCEYNQNTKYVVKALQKTVRSIEPTGEYYDEFYIDDCCDSEEKLNRIEKLLTLCRKMIDKKNTKDKAMWCYTAAFLTDLKGNASEASEILKKAEREKTSDFISESIAVLRIYLDAKLSVYDNAYDAKLFKQINWLDSKIVGDINTMQSDDNSWLWAIEGSRSFYYWNDMMRRILLAEVCPRMLKVGRKVRALQLANMADNRLVGLVDKYYISHWEEQGNDDEKVRTEILSMKQYRYSKGKHNYHDYQNYFFEMIDTIGVDIAIAYVNNVNTPKTKFDKFLNARGYVEKDYLYDILGTQCLRNMRYADAMTYFEKVSSDYQNHLNVVLYYDPFSVERKAIRSGNDFRYAFAREMNSLEMNIKRTKDPNRKAEMMFRFAVGIRNSFGRCWSLTQYYKGSKRKWQNDACAKTAMRKTEQLINSALKTATDDNYAADMLYELSNFKTLEAKYPNSKKAKLVRGRCDNLIDYHANIRKYTRND